MSMKQPYSPVDGQPDGGDNKKPVDTVFGEIAKTEGGKNSLAYLVDLVGSRWTQIILAILSMTFIGFVIAAMVMGTTHEFKMRKGLGQLEDALQFYTTQKIGDEYRLDANDDVTTNAYYKIAQKFENGAAWASLKPEEFVIDGVDGGEPFVTTALTNAWVKTYSEGDSTYATDFDNAHFGDARAIVATKIYEMVNQSHAMDWSLVLYIIVLVFASVLGLLTIFVLIADVSHIRHVKGVSGSIHSVTHVMSAFLVILMVINGLTFPYRHNQVTQIPTSVIKEALGPAWHADMKDVFDEGHWSKIMFTVIAVATMVHMLAQASLLHALSVIETNMVATVTGIHRAGLFDKPSNVSAIKNRNLDNHVSAPGRNEQTTSSKFSSGHRSRGMHAY